MVPRVVGAAARLLCLALALAGCAPQGTPPEPAATGTTPPAATTAPAPADPRTFPPPDPGSLERTFNPGDTSPTWAENLDPDSRFGLHRRQGLAPVLRPEVRVLTPAEAGAISTVAIDNADGCLGDPAAPTMCRFTLEFEALPDGVAVGTVINSGITPSTPTGLLVKVTGVEGNRVRAVQANLADALVQGEFWFEQQFGSDALRADPTLGPGVEIVPVGSQAGPGGDPGRAPRASRDGPTIHEVSLPGTLKFGTEVDGVRVSGALDFGVGCGIAGGVGGTDVAWLEVACRATESTALQVTSPRTGAVSGKATLAVFPLAAIPIPIGPLILVVVADIVVTVDASGQVFADMHYAASQDTTLRAGLKYSVTGGLDHDGALDSRFSTSPDAGLRGAVSARVVPEARLRLSLYGTLGVAAGGFLRFGLTGDPAAHPRWQMSGNLGVFVEAFLGILGWELTARIVYQLPQDFTFATHSNTPPGLTGDLPATTVAVGGFGIQLPKVTAFDEEDGPVAVHWSDPVEGLTAVGTTGAWRFTRLGEHRVRVFATDSDGRTAERFWTVTVVPQQIKVALTLRGPDLAPLPAARAATGTQVVVDAAATAGNLPLGCDRIEWRATGGTAKRDGCRLWLTLGPPGRAVVTATAADDLGSSGSADAVITVDPAPPGRPDPQFVGIELRSNGQVVPPGQGVVGDAPVEVRLTYVNAAQAGIRPVYAWSFARPSERIRLLGPSDELATSTRTFTPPTPWGYSGTFQVIVTDADTGAVLTTRTLPVAWLGLPK